MLLALMFLTTACVEQKFAELDLPEGATQEIAEDIFDGNFPSPIKETVTVTETSQEEEQQQEEQKEEEQVIVTTTTTENTQEEQTQEQTQTESTSNETTTVTSTQETQKEEQKEEQQQQEEEEVIVSTTPARLPTSTTTTTSSQDPKVEIIINEEEEEEQTPEEKEDELVSEVTETSFCATNKYGLEYAERDVLACDTPGNGEKKFLVCHKNLGRLGGMNYITVAEPSVATHESHHGDYVVDCKILQELPKGKKIEDFSCECN